MGDRNGRLLVTGGTGFLGRHVLRSSGARDWELSAPSSSVLDLRDRSAVRDIVLGWRPTAVVHTAYRRDDRAAIVDATRHVAAAAAEVGARLVHVSTDALFAGRSRPYEESDPPSPVHAYGRDKADAERVVAAAGPDHLIARTSLLLGTTEPSSHELAVRDAIEGRSDMRFFTDEVRCPVLVSDVAAALVELAGRPDVRGVLHLAGPRPMSRAELAEHVARRHGWDADRLSWSSLAVTGLVRPGTVILDSSRATGLDITLRDPTS